MDNMTEKSQREYSRVDASIPLGIRPITNEERQRVKSRISGDVTLRELPFDEPSDKVLAEWLKLINSKLDYLLNAFSLQQEGFHCLPVYDVNISGGGMSFIYEPPQEIGSVIEFKTVLDSPSPIALYLYGEVVKCEKINENYRIAVKFINIEEDIRDHIIRFVFHRQRQLLRQKKEMLK